MRAQLRGARLRHRQARQPCGVAVAANTLGAYQQAFKTDPTSAFGGIIAFNRPVDAATAEAVSAQFLEVLLAPAYDGAALAILAAKKNVRVLEVPMGAGQNAFDVKRVGGGWLVQTPDAYNVPRDALKIVTKRQPTEQEMDDLASPGRSPSTSSPTPSCSWAAA